MLLPVSEQTAQDSGSALPGGLKHEALPGFEIRRLARRQRGGEPAHLGALFQFHQ